MIAADEKAPVTPPIEWREPDDAYGWLAVARVFGTLALLWLGARWLIVEISPWMLLPLLFLIGAFAHKITFIVHDCSHMALFHSRTLNRWVGRFAAAAIGADFEEFARVHWLHHRYLAQRVDPQHEDYVGMPGTSAGHILWHLAKPLVGASYYKVVLFSLGRRIISSAQLEEETKLAANDMPRRNQLSTSQRLALIGIMQLGIAVLATWAFATWWLIFLYPVSAGIFGLFFSRVRSYVEHVAPDGAGSAAHVRTHRKNLFDSFLVFELNFNYHVEHHMFPWVASHRLPDLHKLAVAANCHTEESFSRGVLATLRRCLGSPRPPSGADPRGTAARTSRIVENKEEYEAVSR